MRELARHGWHVDYVVRAAGAPLTRPEPNEKELVVLGAAKLGEHAADRQPRDPGARLKAAPATAIAKVQLPIRTAIALKLRHNLQSSVPPCPRQECSNSRQDRSIPLCRSRVICVTMEQVLHS